MAEIQTCESSTDYGLPVVINCKSIELRICQAQTSNIADNLHEKVVLKAMELMKYN